MNRWSVSIDIEGFSTIYKQDHGRALLLLGQLTSDLYRIGTSVFPRSPERLFVHQFGDGFLILSNFPEANLGRPISIAVSLMQSTLLRGGLARAAVSDGDFADILGCYPDEVRRNLIGHGVLRIGEGVMTIYQVMGDALINSYKLANKAPKGPCLFVDARLKEYVPTEGIVILREEETILEIDWIHSEPPLVRSIFEGIELEIPSARDLERAMAEYLQRYELSLEWRENASRLLPSRA